MTSFTFPSDRADRTTLLSGSISDDRLRFWHLTEHIAYSDIRSIVADYINTTFSDPAATHGERWTVAALPGTDDTPNQRRLLTLTCGSLETLFVTEFTNEDDDSIELEMTVNTSVADGYSDAQLDISTEVVTASRGTYPSHEVWTWRIDLGALLTDDADVDFGIDDDLFDDLAYSLNARLLSEPASSAGSRELANDLLANDLLAEGYRQLRDSEQ